MKVDVKDKGKPWKTIDVPIYRLSVTQSGPYFGGCAVPLDDRDHPELERSVMSLSRSRREALRQLADKIADQLSAPRNRKKARR